MEKVTSKLFRGRYFITARYIVILLGDINKSLVKYFSVTSIVVIYKITKTTLTKGRQDIFEVLESNPASTCRSWRKHPMHLSHLELPFFKFPFLCNLSFVKACGPGAD